MTEAAKQIIQNLELQPHPEGGFYREVYRDEKTLLGSGENFPAGRSASTFIYFLIPEGIRTKLHRIKSDEQWLHLSGDSIIVHCFSLQRGHQNYRCLPVGNPLTHTKIRTSFHHVAYAGEWFGAQLNPETVREGYALLGLFVAPGFDFQDLEMAKEDKLKEEYPGFRKELSIFF